jgi:hypothetical protein
MKKKKKGAERGARLGAALVVLIAVLVLFFVASFVYRLAREIPEAVEESVPAGIRVEVLNGSGRNRVARKVAAVLREKGFDVVNIDNAESSDFAKTVVVDRVSGDMRYAGLLARVIGCDDVVAQPDPSLFLEVTVIVGRDWAKLFPEATREDW